MPGDQPTDTEKGAAGGQPPEESIHGTLSHGGRLNRERKRQREVEMQGDQPTETEMGEAGGQPPAESIQGSLSPGGRFIRYNIFGRIFLLTSKYKPPIIFMGESSYGIVCSAMNSETEERVAIKRIDFAFDDNTAAKRTLREIKLLRHFDHENVSEIVAIRDIIPPPERQAYGNNLYIACELMDTDLDQIIRSNEALSEEHCQYLLYQILRGLKYIHSANVLLGDLKPSNLLINDKCDLKICGFGFARTTSEIKFMTKFMNEPFDARWYRAPELLLSSDLCAATFLSAAIDVWSVGCIFMELMARKPLFPGRGFVHQLRLLLERIDIPNETNLDFLKEESRKYMCQLPRHPRQSLSEKFPNVNPSAIELIERMLTFDPRQRITVEEALKHPYLASFHDISDEPVCTVPFSFDFEQHTLSNEQIQELLYEEILAFYPAFYPEYKQ